LRRLKSYALAKGNLSDFLRLLNEQHIGGGQLRLDESGNIIGVYSHCYCGIPKATKSMPACYCECSAGWFEGLFTNVFERSVQVKIIHTILDGSVDCNFEISLEK
jgi:predicted hydrocarbon binding protein